MPSGIIAFGLNGDFQVPPGHQGVDCFEDGWRFCCPFPSKWTSHGQQQCRCLPRWTPRKKRGTWSCMRWWDVNSNSVDAKKQVSLPSLEGSVHVGTLGGTNGNSLWSQVAVTCPKVTTAKLPGFLSEDLIIIFLCGGTTKWSAQCFFVKFV